MSRAFATEQSAKGWIIPVSVQTIPAILLLIGVPFCIESPRWLVAHGMKEQAIENMNKIRPARERENGQTVLEIEGFEMAIEESKKQNQGSWKDLFGRTYINRTIVSIVYHTPDSRIEGIRGFFGGRIVETPSFLGCLVTP